MRFLLNHTILVQFQLDIHKNDINPVWNLNDMVWFWWNHIKIMWKTVKGHQRWIFMGDCFHFSIMTLVEMSFFWPKLSTFSGYVVVIKTLLVAIFLMSTPIHQQSSPTFITSRHYGILMPNFLCAYKFIGCVVNGFS